MPSQRLTLTLDGITAADYLAWVRDPEPAALGHDLVAIGVDADPLGDTIEIVLSWTGTPPPAAAAAPVAGFPLTPEVVAVRRRRDELTRRRWRRRSPLRPRPAIAA